MSEKSLEPSRILVEFVCSFIEATICNNISCLTCPFVVSRVVPL